MKLGDLQEKINKNLETDRKTLEMSVQANLNDLEKSLKQSIRSVVNTIEGDIQKLQNRTALISKVSLKIYFHHLICALAIILGLITASLMTTNLLSNKIANLLNEKENLQMTIAEQKNTLKQLKIQGIIFHSQTNPQTYKAEYFLIFPHNVKAIGGYSMDGKQAYKLEAIPTDFIIPPSPTSSIIPTQK